MIDMVGVNLLYEYANTPLDIYIVNDKEFKSARVRTRKLRESLDQSMDLEIQDFFGTLDYIYRELYMLPIEISYNDRLLEKIGKIEQLSRTLKAKLDGNSLNEIEEIKNFVFSLERRKTPFETELYRLLDNGKPDKLEISDEESTGKTVIITKRKRHQQLLQHVMEDLGVNAYVDVRVPTQLKSNFFFYKQTIVVGPLDFFGNVSGILGNLVTTKLVNLSHFKPQDIQFGLFLNSQVPYRRQVTLTSFEGSAHDLAQTVAQENIQFSDNPLADWNIPSYSENVNDSQKDDEIVECRLMRFVDGRYVLFPEEDIELDEERIDVLVDAENSNERVVEISVAELDEDSIILLRDGETSMQAIIPEADKYMGKSAPQHRSNQAKWKIKLLEKLRTLGRERVDRDLKDRGIERPYSKDWSRPTGMRPQSDKNFEILLSYLGFSDMERRQIFESSTRIRGAHSTAGRNITHGLKQAFANVNIDDIYAAGSLSKSLNDDSGARVTALVCEGFDVNLHKVRQSMTRRILGVEDNHK